MYPAILTRVWSPASHGSFQDFGGGYPNSLVTANQTDGREDTPKYRDDEISALIEVQSAPEFTAELRSLECDDNSFANFRPTCFDPLSDCRSGGVRNVYVIDHQAAKTIVRKGGITAHNRLNKCAYFIKVGICHPTQDVAKVLFLLSAVRIGDYINEFE
jgi:hypothetical protein